MGAPDAEHVIVMMGSGAEAAQETVEYLSLPDEKVGLLKVRLYRPFSVKHFLKALPPTVKKIAVLDRTKEAGAPGDPLYLDIVNAIQEGLKSEGGSTLPFPVVVGGRYGLSSKEFTPAMVKAVFDNFAAASTERSLHGRHQRRRQSHQPEPTIPSFRSSPTTLCAPCFTASAPMARWAQTRTPSRSSARTPANYAQGYFVYDSKKSGAMTVSHLRFGPNPIRSSYLVSKANFVACHQWIFLERYDMLESAGRRRRVSAQQPLRPGRSLGPSATPGARTADPEEGEVLSSSMPTRWRVTPAWARA